MVSSVSGLDPCSRGLDSKTLHDFFADWSKGGTDMSNTIEGDIDIDFLGVLTLTIDIELVTFE